LSIDLPCFSSIQKAKHHSILEKPQLNQSQRYFLTILQLRHPVLTRTRNKVVLAGSGKKWTLPNFSKNHRGNVPIYFSTIITSQKEGDVGKGVVII
jgi:hypothetical protein